MSFDPKTPTQMAQDKLRREHHQEMSKMTTAIGMCVMAWAYVELYLYMLFEHLLRAEPQLATATWTSMINFNAKLAAVDSIFRIALKDDSDALQIWTKIQDRLGKKAKKRNEIVHSTVITETGPDFTKHQVVLIPYMTLTPADQIKLSSQQVTERATSFSRLADAVRWMDSAYGRNLPPEDRGPEPDLVLAIRNLIAQKPQDA